MERFTILRVILAQLCSRSLLFNWNDWNKLKFETNLKQLKQFGTNLEQFQISAAWAPIKSSFSWNWLLNRHLITQVPSSTLFEIEFPIYWSIFYSISCDFRRFKDLKLVFFAHPPAVSWFFYVGLCSCYLSFILIIWIHLVKLIFDLL